MKTWERVFVGAFGLLLLGIGVYVLMLDGVSAIYRSMGGIVLCVLGGNAVYCALVGKRPWISKIGPLP
ncbi:MAG: hypothetical protein EPN34_00810 [Burkholderiaceae bacterium]|nr:MAG: hypothetical protein EPN34_00810 [Burkholderiaceae bacterium]